ncbi:MAG: rubredoxin [Candidatus Methanomethylicaceae archaeon]
MEKWSCIVCGYVYDPEKGDEIGGIPPGTPFESLPESWVCPVCGASKEMFEKIE